jgi:drug/metabolite transporter (DMT)-like permease
MREFTLDNRRIYDFTITAPFVHSNRFMKTIAKWLRNGDRQADRFWGIAALLLVTLLWGSTFVIVKDALTAVPASVLLSVRFILSGLCLVPFLGPFFRPDWKLWSAGTQLGLMLLLGYATQTIGLQYTSVHRSAFVTALNVFFVPLFLGCWGHRIARKIWLASLLAIAGVGFLSYDVTPPNWGDLWTLGTAIAYALYIIGLGHYSKTDSVLALTAMQLWVAALGSTVWAIAAEPTWFTPAQLAQLPWGTLVYLAIVCTSATTLLQAWGQRHVSAAQSAVLFTLEPVWASGFALVILGETLGLQGLMGAAFVIAATFVTVPFPAQQNRAVTSIPDLAKPIAAETPPSPRKLQKSRPDE